MRREGMEDHEVPGVRVRLVVGQATAGQVREAPRVAARRDDDVGEVDRTVLVSLTRQHGRCEDLHPDLSGSSQQEIRNAAHEADVVEVLRAALV